MAAQGNSLKDFIYLLERALKIGSPFPKERVAMEILINPAAGSLRKKGKRSRLIKSISQWMASQEERPAHEGLNIQLHLTDSTTHAQDWACKILAGLVQEGWAQRKIIVLAGGDGFHKDVITSLMQRYPELLHELILFRLPLGTGNDGADGESITDTLDILTHPARKLWRPCLEVRSKGLPTDYCLNIASFGLDAYVCLLTERWKKLPGDIYKFMVDLSILFYDWIYPIRESRLELSYQGKSRILKDSYLLTVLGAKGYSTYGGKKYILPNSNNLMLTQKVSLIKRILHKGRFLRGTHGELPFVGYYHADRLVLHYPDRLLMELDGEVTHLKKENFPVELLQNERGFWGLSSDLDTTGK